jgi:flagellar assembly protein FliH
MLHLNPADATSIREQIGEQLQQSGTHIVDDVTVTPGGCSLKAGISEIDATMETRWRRVLESIGSEPLEWQSTS